MELSERVNRLCAKFRELFGSPPEVVTRAPGRVNLIGEHTDYNEGFVFPAAIDRDLFVAISVRSDNQVRAYSINFEQSSSFTLDRLDSGDEPSERWSTYLRGLAWALQNEGIELKGMNVAMVGTVPLGAGLSSSAALLVSAGLAFAAGAGSQVEPVKLALLAQKAEREYVGVNVGIMDQYISALGVCDHALLIDTRNLSHQAVPLPAEGVSIVILDTQKKRGLVDSEYNRRREECQEAVELISRKLPRVKALRDVSLADFAEVEASLPDVVRRRARHVVTEDARTLDAADALRREDLHRFGELMYASHRSLRDDYQVSCMELDALVEAACKIDGVYGCRMTGGGFGGCAVALARNSALGEIQESAPREYREKTGLSPAIYVTSASAGACLLRQAQTTVSA